MLEELAYIGFQNVFQEDRLASLATAQLRPTYPALLANRAAYDKNLRKLASQSPTTAA